MLTKKWGMVVLSAGAIACTAGGDPSRLSTSNASGAMGAGGGFGGGFTVGAGGGTSDCIHCSSDLHHVLDCNDNVIMTCPPDQGCAPGGVCVEPCDSAQQNKSTIGCDFYSVIPGPEYETRGGCFAALLANTWTTPITITASWGSQTADGATIARVPVGNGSSLSYAPLTGGQLQPGEIGIVFLAQYPSGDIYQVPCPPGTQTLMNIATEVDGTGYGNAFHITTDRPVVAYDIFPWGGASSFVTSATLLLPTPTWGDNLIAVDAYEANPSLSFVNGYPHIQIVAAEDNTSVTISPTAAITGGTGVPGTPQGQPITYQINAGQFLQIQQPARLVGSPIQATAPISVWGGTACMNVPIGSYACDSAHQQLMHIQALGHTYLGAQYRPRAGGGDEAVPYAIVGAVDGTQLTWDPAPPPGAPTTLSSGQFVEFTTGLQFSVTSQDENHPFYLAIYMTGASMGGETGDPEYVNVVSPQQYLDHYLFVTDPTYANTNLVFTRARASDNTFKDVQLDCMGVLGGWQPIGSAGQYEFVRVDITQNFQPVGSCNNGVHTADSEAPFGLTVWGFDSYASYGYPGGMSVKPINTVVVPPTPE